MTIKKDEDIFIQYLFTQKQGAIYVQLNTYKQLFKRNVLNRYEWDDEEGNRLVNNFGQISQIAKQLKNFNLRAFTAFMSLLKDKIELEKNVLIEVSELYGRDTFHEITKER